MRDMSKSVVDTIQKHKLSYDRGTELNNRLNALNKYPRSNQKFDIWIARTDKKSAVRQLQQITQKKQIK